MNTKLRLLAIGGFVFLGGMSALSQVSNRATQAVSFAVHRTDAFSLQGGIVQKETNHEPAGLKITVSSNQTVGRPLSDPLSLRARTAHLDVTIVHSKELYAAIGNGPLLVTITD